MQIIGFLLVFAVAVVVIAFVVGVLRIERKADAKEEYEVPAPEEGPEEPEKLVDLVEYYADFDDDRREIVPEQPKETAPQPAEEGVKFDKLCNLKVGRGFLLDCQKQLHEARESGRPHLAVYFDFNRFRFLNSLRGYAMGDYALTRIAQELGKILPHGALITRLSADHFVSIFPYIDEVQLENTFAQIKRVSDQIKNEIGAKSGLQICMGVARTQSPEDYDVFKLIRRANIARHCIKASRAESYSVFDEAMLTSYLFGESALEDYNDYQYGDDFTLFLLPQLRMQNRRVTSCDSRAFWNCVQQSDNPLVATDGAVMTSHNFKVAYQVCRAMSRWRKVEATIVPVMVTLSEIELFRENIDEFFLRLLNEFQLEPSYLTVVVSLHTIRIHPEIMRGQMEKLAAIGIKLAVCDIDRAFDSPELLEGLPIHCLKLHKSFSHEVERFPERQQAVLRIIDRAKALGADTLFEEVGAAATVAWLSEAGGTLAQGRFVGEYMIPETFIKELHGVLASAHYDPNATVLLDDRALQKGDFVVY